MIEVVGDDGLTEKVPLLKRFAPPPPPPPLEVLSENFARPLPPELLAPLRLPPTPVDDIGPEIAETLELRDVTDAISVISLVSDPISDLIRALIEALEQEQTQAAPEAAFSME